MMTTSILALALAACGGKPAPASPGSTAGSAGEHPGVVEDTRTEFEKRLDTVCEQLQPRLWECAVADARAEHAKGKLSQQELDQLMTADMQSAHGAKFRKEVCRRDLTSFQLRVLEVCHREESECGPLGECLRHLNDKPNQ